MSPVRVVVGPVGGSGIGEAIAALDGVEVTVVTEMEAVPAALEAAPVLVSFRWSASWLTPRLRWIQSVSAGTDQFPLEALTANGTVLTSARGIHEPQVSEHALGLLLAMIHLADGAVKRSVPRGRGYPPCSDRSASRARSRCTSASSRGTSVHAAP